MPNFNIQLKSLFSDFKSTKVRLKNVLIGIIIGSFFLGIGIWIFLIVQPKPTNSPQLNPPAKKIATKSTKPAISPTKPTNQSSTELLNPLPSEIKNSSITFIDKGKVFLLDGATNSLKELGSGDETIFSPDHTKIAYIRMDSIEESKDIFIYDIKGGKIANLKTQEWRLRGVSWSPNGRYLITDSGTDIYGSDAVYEYPSGNKLTSVTVYVNKKGWLNDNEFVFVEPQEVIPDRPWQDGRGLGLAKISIVTGTKQVLLTATALDDFDLIKVENGIVYYSKRTVKDVSGWEYESQTAQATTYWQMNGDGGGKKEIVKPETLREQVQRLIPTLLSEYNVFSGPIPHSADKNWVIFDIYKGHDTSDSLICVVNLSNPASSFRKIVTGNQPSW